MERKEKERRERMGQENWGRSNLVAEKKNALGKGKKRLQIKGTGDAKEVKAFVVQSM